MKWRRRSDVLLAPGAAFPEGEYDERLPWHFRLPGRPSWKRMVAACELISAVAGSRAFVLTPREAGGWAGVPKRHLSSAVEFATLREALSHLQDHGYYRAPVFADYYLTDTSYGWLVKFCHEGDWHAFLPEKIACSLPFKRALFTLKLQTMPPWPPADSYDDE